MEQLKCKVVMLPTEKATSHISMRNDNSGGVPYGTLQYADKLSTIDKTNLRWTSQHLYLVSNRAIEKGNDFLVNGCVLKCKYIKKSVYGTGFFNIIVDFFGLEHHETVCERVEASSNKKLNLPLLPIPFLKKYVEKQGNIKDVLIEMGRYCSDYDDVEGWLAPVTRSDNTVILDKVRDNWKLEDIRELCQKAFKAGMTYEVDGKLDIKHWLDIHLPK